MGGGGCIPASKSSRKRPGHGNPPQVLMHLAWLKPPFILAAPHFARRLSCMCAARDISTRSRQRAMAAKMVAGWLCGQPADNRGAVHLRVRDARAAPWRARPAGARQGRFRQPVDGKVRMRKQGTEADPIMLGWDAAGIVEALGRECSLFRPGDHVYYAGNINRPGTIVSFGG